jgi:predicted transposase YbfD/YdcC
MTRRKRCDPWKEHTAFAAESLLSPLGMLTDPRVARTRKHPLVTVVAIAILAVFAGADGWEDMAEFAKVKRDWLAGLLDMRGGVPSPDTFRRVISRLEPKEFASCFSGWVKALLASSVPGTRVIPIDGKTLCGSFDTAAGQSPLHLVHAWVAEHDLLLGQLATDAKSNEITAIPALLRTIDVAGATVTIDAMGCQREIAATIIDRGADYLLAVKGNQELLHRELVELFDDVVRNGSRAGVASRHCETTDGDHGRIEVRRVWTVDDVGWFKDRSRWRGLASFAMIESERTVGGKTTLDRRYFISSLSGLGPEEMGRRGRAHWSIENRLHWCLDVAFGEDASRIRRDHGPENYATIRRFALQAFKRDRTSTRGLAAKARRAGWDDAYLLTVLAGLVAPGN